MNHTKRDEAIGGTGAITSGVNGCGWDVGTPVAAARLR